MIVSPSTHQQLKHRGLKLQFLVHLLKITRLPSHVPNPNVDSTLLKNARKDGLKVTALYNSKQIALGDFPIVMNECVINQKVSCQLNISKSDAQSKLHFYIDQAYSSGLTGHLALDLKEFIREGETELYLKYPLHANTSRYSQGPVLKMMIQNLGKCDLEASFDEDSEFFVLQHESIEWLRSSRISSLEDPGCMLQDLDSSSNFSLSGKAQLRCLDELEGALSDIDEKLKVLVSTYKGTECHQNGDSLSREVECQSSMTSPLLSSLHTGTSMDSHSELFEEQCTDSDDVFDSYLEPGGSMYPLSTSKHLRTLSDVSSFTSSLGYPQVLSHRRNISMDEGSSEFWYSQSSVLSDEDHDHDQGCLDECFVCSSTYALRSYKGIHASLSKSKSVSLPPRLLHQSSSGSAATGLPAPLEKPCSKKNEEAEAPVVRKGPGLLRSLFGAVVVAGVSLLGVRNASLAKDQPRPSMQAKLSHTSRTTFSRSGRSLKHHYSFSR